MLEPYSFIVIAIAAWRLAFLLTNEDAPFNLVAHYRERWPLGGLMMCIKCMSLWTAALCLVLWFTPFQAIVWLLALSGAALMLGTYTGATHG